MPEPALTKERRDDPAAGAALTEAAPKPEKARSLWQDAWRNLRSNPLFLISAVLILVLLTMVAFPGLFADGSPRDGDQAAHYLTEPNLGHLFANDWLGYDAHGRSVYVRVIHGARASVIAGIAVTLVVAVFGTIVGMLAGYFGGWLDSLLSRITDIFFGIPFLLGAMVVLTAVGERSLWMVITALAILGWTQVARVARGSVLTVKQSDYVQAAKALGASTWRILMRHVLPNAIAPVIVVATVALGGYIGAEATLSYLGLGLAEPAVSWGVDIDAGKDQLRNAPHVLLFPALMVSLTVLAFIMLGDAVRSALDPKSR
ncbi:ABC transporter permease [Streptomyces sulphureus]|uniref:ABC transporter permease n=1 Tax=Streptomyces sulphureus TaxID=47758 RepID=UPI00036D062A|nr:ABC transporter permease [Streptomyces sulphureus]